MGRIYESLTDALIEWIGRQHLFFVATAPLAPDGHVNLSPKGLDSLRVLDARTLAYVDLTGSGAETIAHLRENGRITLMWCAFEGPPRIVRVHGEGDVVALDDPRVAGRLPEMQGARAALVVTAKRISDSCGHGVPLYDFQGQRSRLTDWLDTKSDEDLEAYRQAKNLESLDGLPALEPAD